jgi:hypothetical protein
MLKTKYPVFFYLRWIRKAVKKRAGSTFSGCGFPARGGFPATAANAAVAENKGKAHLPGINPRGL